MFFVLKSDAWAVEKCWKEYCSKWNQRDAVQQVFYANKTPAELHHAGFIYYNLHDARNHENQKSWKECQILKSK